MYTNILLVMVILLMSIIIPVHHSIDPDISLWWSLPLIIFILLAIALLAFRYSFLGKHTNHTSK